MGGGGEGNCCTKTVQFYYTLKQKVHRLLEININLSLLNLQIGSNTDMVEFCYIKCISLLSINANLDYNLHILIYIFLVSEAFKNIYFVRKIFKSTIKYVLCRYFLQNKLFGFFMKISGLYLFWDISICNSMNFIPYWFFI